MSRVWKQYRRVDAGELEVEDLDMHIEVENTDDAEHRFDVQIYNLTKQSWRRISEDDYCRVALGWEDGDVQNVIHGVIEKKTTQREDMDQIFRLKGIAETDHLLKLKRSRSWGGHLSPDRVAHDIAGMIGLTAGDIDSVGQELGERFAISRDKPVRHWLDLLVGETERLTDIGWEWFVDGGRLYFVRKDGRSDQAVRLSYDTTLISINDIESEDGAGDAEGLEFEAMCEPNLRKGAAVAVDTDDYTGAYKVREYKFTSDTTTGQHTVEGKLDPLDIQYRPQHQTGGGGGMVI